MAKATPTNRTDQAGEPVFKGKQKKYYQRLIDLRDQLVDEVRTLSAHSLTTSKQAGEELADIGSDNFIREMELGLMSEEGRKIRLIQDAIANLKSGKYGLCDECGGRIQEGRLEAIPYAQTCVGCQSRLEREAAYGPPAKAAH